LDSCEEGVLASFVEKRGLQYQKLFDVDNASYVTATSDYSDSRVVMSCDAHDDADLSYWTRSWDGCIENKDNGMC
jgi:hypothetical protein